MPRRPRTVHTAGLLTAVAGVENVLVGVVLIGLVVAGALPLKGGLPVRVVLVVAFGYCVVGALTLLGVRALLEGRFGGRVFVTALMTVRIVGACVSLGLFGTWYSAGSVVGIVLSLVVVGLLWDSRANAYFHRTGRRPDPGQGQ